AVGSGPADLGGVCSRSSAVFGHYRVRALAASGWTRSQIDRDQGTPAVFDQSLVPVSPGRARLHGGDRSLPNSAAAIFRGDPVFCLVGGDRYRADLGGHALL